MNELRDFFMQRLGVKRIAPETERDFQSTPLWYLELDLLPGAGASSR